MPNAFAAVLVAAGSSRRMGFDKILAMLGNVSVLRRSFDALQACPSIESIVIVGSPAVFEHCADWRLNPECTKLLALIPGGKERQDSVRAGLGAIPPHISHVAIHDAARPLVCPQAIEETIAAARNHGAAVLAHPIPDTVKRLHENGQIAENVDRTNLWAMETPQIARRDWLVQAMDQVAAAGVPVTDEVSALQFAQFPVHAVCNNTPNFKITWPGDIALAERLL